MSLLEIKNINYSFFNKLILKDINFSLSQGEALGFIGINGSGKTTTMKCISGVLTADSGEIIIDGFNLRDNPFHCKNIVGYLPEKAPIYPEMKAKDFLNFIAGAYLKDSTLIKERIDYVVEVCHLKEIFHKQIKTLSKGFRHRVSLACAIIHDPKILIFDEPSDGLDPFQKEIVYNLMTNLKDKALLFSTHNLEEIEKLCHRVIVISDGKILKQINNFQDFCKNNKKRGLNDYFSS